MFAEKIELARYIDPNCRASGNRPSVAAYLPDEKEDYLSVNSLEIESLIEICDYYRAVFDDDKVAIHKRKVHVYNEAGKRAEVKISYNRTERAWIFATQQGEEDCYRVREVPRHGDRPASNSHTGVEFIREISNQNNLMKFARKMAHRRGGKYHLF